MNTAKVPTLPDVLLSQTGPATKQDRRHRHPYRWAWIRRQFFGTGFLSSFVSVTPGGAINAAVSAALGAVS